jgi:hypothetical protein
MAPYSDPEGPKTYGSYGSGSGFGSATLAPTMQELHQQNKIIITAAGRDTSNSKSACTTPYTLAAARPPATTWTLAIAASPAKSGTLAAAGHKITTFIVVQKTITSSMEEEIKSKDGYFAK